VDYCKLLFPNNEGQFLAKLCNKNIVRMVVAALFLCVKHNTNILKYSEEGQLLLLLLLLLLYIVINVYATLELCCLVISKKVSFKRNNLKPSRLAEAVSFLTHIWDLLRWVRPRPDKVVQKEFSSLKFSEYICKHFTVSTSTSLFTPFALLTVSLSMLNPYSFIPIVTILLPFQLGHFFEIITKTYTFSSSSIIYY